MQRSAPHAHAASEAPSSRRLAEIGPAEAIELLSSATFGRVVFTSGALPAIRPVNHIVDDGEIVIRTRRLSPIGAAFAIRPEIVTGHRFVAG